MRDGAWKKVAGLSAALLTWAGLSDAQAQQYDVGYVSQPQTQQVAYSEEEAVDEMAAMRARLDRYEAELAALRGQGHTQFADHSGNIENRLTALENMQDGEAEEAKVGEPKKVDLITKPEMKVRGRIHFDHVMFDEDPAVGDTMSNETGFRTARIGVAGTVYENVKAQVEVEFEGEETDFKDIYIELQELGYNGYTFRAGHFKEPLSLEELTSSNYTMFMERAMVTNLFAPARKFGVMWYDNLGNDPDVLWAIGAFRESSTDNPPQANSSGTVFEDSGDVCVTGRLAGNPYYDEPSEGRCLTHLGVGYSWRNMFEDVDAGGPAEDIEFETDQELGTQDGYLSIVIPDEDNYHLFNIETGVNSGPIGAASEYFAVTTDDTNLWGAYAETWYFLTGEHRGYDYAQKTWGRTKPFEDFFCVRTADGVCKGSGAWAVKARVSYLDLDDSGVVGTRGENLAFTTGFNWYLNPYTRMMFDYVYNETDIADDGFGDLQGNFFGTRLQVDF